MTSESETTLHPDDAELIRAGDGALLPDERSALEAHVATCLLCRSRRVTLERRVRRLSELLRATDVPAPVAGLRPIVTRARVRTLAGWNAAAAVLLAFGAAMAVTPVRAWFVSVGKSAWARVSPASKGATEADAGDLSFVPDGSTLIVRIPERAGVALTVRVVEGDRVTASGGAAGGILVLPSEVRFAGDGDSTAHYVVSVPLRVETVRVVVGEGRARIFRPRTVGERWSIPPAVLH